MQVIQIWDDLNAERSGFYRAFWTDAPDSTTGSPVIGYCSPGGSRRTIAATAAEAVRVYPHAKVYRRGRLIRDGLAGASLR